MAGSQVVVTGSGFGASQGESLVTLNGTPVAIAVACSFIALAAWVRQLPFWLLNSRVLTECSQSRHMNVLKPFILLMV
jgi:hypothetical protein